ncbi:Flagellar motor switch protein FliG [Thalassovita gelatinovora]|uniref:Flagellar motor switch protein FliG n=1 Tax=Thalassovita gelatinovora TaxID=53501 RepID=A0A0P1G5K2_THAGE|nr:flagellar motor switch protein FliG [Thalassovita gelatinovora]QIZ78974.1 flagellar motor switch protein FliG [Thalassovita gelatinovora]CUH68494.1 Flagellar motor switch protein FliG [Thalassovita gelatinovora]SEQ53462.1 flagellar motor switch protein FliG [Thalassovita gelatinovora]
MPRTPSIAELGGTRKAAVLMMLFGEEAASAVLKLLNPQEVQQLGTAMYGVRNVDHSTVNEVLNEFLHDLREQTGLGVGANDYIKDVLTQALGQDKAQSVLSRIPPSSNEHPIQILEWMDAPAVAELITDEHPQIIALIVAALDHSVGAEVLKLLPEEQQPDIVQRISELSTVQPDALRNLEEVIQRKFQANTTLRASQMGGVKAAARIMNFTKQDMEQRILKVINKDDKELAIALQDNMFVFDNLIKSGDRAIQTLLREVNERTLVIALRGADEALQDKLLNCMSTRAAANIREEMETLGPVRLTEVQTAQKEVIAVARRLSDSGEIMLAGRGGEIMV